MITESRAQPPEPPPLLVGAFLEASRDALAFLAGEKDFRSTVTVQHLRNGEIIPVAPNAVTGLFWAHRAFSTSRLTGEFVYGERELEINLIVGLPPSKLLGLLPSKRGVGPYGLWEWEAALGMPPLLAEERITTWCATAERVRTAVTALGDAFRSIAPRITAAGSDTVRQIEAARDQRLAAEKEEHAQWRHTDATARAADAFRAGDYRQVVSLLAPHEARLTPAERKKLALARKYL